MRRIVVTGATGVVGTALVKDAASKGDAVYAICRPRSKRLFALAQIPSLHIIECDLHDTNAMCEKIGHADDFFHLGWQGTVEGRNDPLLQHANIAMTLDMVHAAHALGCTAFLGAGSQAEYGCVSGVIAPDMPVKPNTCYGAAKLAAGYLSRELCRQKGMRHIWARLFSVFGENDWDGSFVNYLIGSLMKNETPGLTKCEQRWNYLYSGDLAHILHALIARGNDGEIYNVGSKASRLLREYGEDIRSVVNPDIALGFGAVPYKENQVMEMVPDVSAVIRDIQDFHETPFQDAIRKIVQAKRSSL